MCRFLDFYAGIFQVNILFLFSHVYVSFFLIFLLARNTYKMLKSGNNNGYSCVVLGFLDKASKVFLLIIMILLVFPRYL